MKCSGDKKIRVTMKSNVIRFDVVCRGHVDRITEIPYSEFSEYIGMAEKFVTKYKATKWFYGGG